MVRIENSPLQSRPEEVYGVEHAPPSLQRRLLAGAIGTLLAGASIAADLDARSGNYILHAPTVESVQEEYHAAPAEQTGVLETDATARRLVAISWNKWEGKFRPAGIRGMIEEFDPDVIAMQEATPQLAEWYAKQFPEWWIVFAEASRDLDKIQGQITMSRYEPTKIRTLSMAGSSWTEKAGHLATGNLHYVQARRAAVAITFKKDDEEYTVSNTHLSHFAGHPIQQNQTSEYIEWMTKNNVQVSLGDYNAEYDSMVAAHQDTGYEVPLITDPTYRDERTIDFCVYDPEAVSYVSSEVLPEPMTDHHPIVCIFGDFDSDNPAGEIYTTSDEFVIIEDDE